MLAQLLYKSGAPLILREIPKPTIGPDEVLIRVEACGVCRTDLHIVEGDLPLLMQPLILGHQVVGIVEAIGTAVTDVKPNQRVGATWLANSCKQCHHCLTGKENLCDLALFTGYSVQGGFAEYIACKANYIIKLPLTYSAIHLAPLLCAGLIGFRAYQKASEAKILGFYGFGASAHILLQVAKQEGKQVFVFTRKESKSQKFAKKLGADWVGNTEENPPASLDAALIFAPCGEIIPKALKHLSKGGSCICVGIHMSDISSFPYQDLFYEKNLTCVSNLTRKDALDFFSFVEKHPIHTNVTTYPLEQANQALQDLKNGLVNGALVLSIKKS